MQISRRVALAAMALFVACGRQRGEGRGAAPDAGSMAATPNAMAQGAPRAGMIWIAPGLLHAGSEVDDVPRVADAELPGVDIPLEGFYMDALPWPNEEGAIPTTNVSLDEAKRLCNEKKERLCTELEWERACKGPANWRFEYGQSYNPAVCGVGVSPASASQRPSGQRPACRSAFGVRDLHGGASEWTDSHWARGSAVDAGVIRGGGDVAGELTTRCAFARPLGPSDRSSSTGFRCCSERRNGAGVELEVKKGPAFERTANTAHPSPPLDALNGTACGPPSAPAPCSFARAWTWRPAPNIELSLSGGCVGRDPSARCALAVSREVGDRVQTLGQIDTGRAIPEVVLVASLDRRVRVRGADVHGLFFHEIVFSYGRVTINPVH